MNSRNQKAKICYICGKKFGDKHAHDKNIVKLEIIISAHVTIEVLDIVYEI